MKVVACAREASARSEIAVFQADTDVDPVGACVGMKGWHRRSFKSFEQIDIVPYDRDPARFVCAAIQPAEVNKVIVDESERRMELVVPDEKLSIRHWPQRPKRAPRRASDRLKPILSASPSSARLRKKPSPHFSRSTESPRRLHEACHGSEYVHSKRLPTLPKKNCQRLLASETLRQRMASVEAPRRPWSEQVKIDWLLRRRKPSQLRSASVSC